MFDKYGMHSIHEMLTDGSNQWPHWRGCDERGAQEREKAPRRDLTTESTWKEAT